MSDRHRAIYVAANAHQAHLLRNLLADAGIASFVSNDTLNGVHFAAGDWMVRAAGGPGFAPTAPKIVVHEDDVEDAREILMEAEATLAGAETAPELVTLVDETGEESSWPMCPHCARPRLATCPVCETSGTDFAEAFLPEQGEEVAEGEASRMVLCPTCDEPFAPRFPARCEWCGHRFRDGYEAPQAEPLTTPPRIFTEMNGRVLALVAIMVGLIAALFGWFAMMLDR